MTARKIKPGNDPIEALKDAEALLRYSDDFSRQDIKDVFDLIKDKVDVKYADIKNKSSRKLVKQLVEAKLDGMKKVKKVIKKERKRKREDEEEEKKDEKAKAKLKEVGKAVKKSARKEKGKLGILIKAIHNANPVKDKYWVAVVEFYDGGSKHFTITPFNKEKIIEHLTELSKGKEMHEDADYSGKVADIFIPGKTRQIFQIGF